MSLDEIGKAIDAYRRRTHEFEAFKRSVQDYFTLEPELNDGSVPIIHSMKSRLKDVDHLRDKLTRKDNTGDSITADDIFERITDLAGVRILHLHQGQFQPIHDAIMRRVAGRDWVLAEDPVAYSWDPEARQFYEKLGLKVRIKESFYTSIHYVVRPRLDSHLACEIQVRTLFEEIWGEIDHAINYPHPTNSSICRDQIRVLARLVSTGTRLADSIFSSFVNDPAAVRRGMSVTPESRTAERSFDVPLIAAPPVRAPDPPPPPPPDEPPPTTAPDDVMVADTIVASEGK
ncbi:(p)ppGpp synthetase [Sorangium sp. So ce1182]|uniref:(p)ppGpp synthetase n=1 Tax=Sorangium sp. So ce1182 TaxID=3133334 RepID=UPI003F61F3DD